MGAPMMAAPLRTILDTNVLIDESSGSISGDLAISAASLAELHFGVHVAREPTARAQRLARLATVEREFHALPFDSAVATSYGILAAVTQEAGRQPRRRIFDLLIAATAHAHGARLATRHVRDFEHLADHIEVVEVG